MAGKYWRSRPNVLGTLCGSIAAIGYTAANCCLRAAATGSVLDPVWISCVKALPTAAVCGSIVLAAALRGHRAWPPGRVLGALVLASLLGQVGGNVAFQWSLGVIGIGLTVPLCMGTVIVASAILARVYLHEPVKPLAAASMAVLIAAIWILSLGAGEVHASITGAAPQAWIVVAGVLAACLSGVAYSVLGVVIRYGVTGKASVAATTFIVGFVGVVFLGLLSCARLGWQGMGATTAGQWAVMIAAGLFNLAAFVALTKALQLTSVVYVNAINASQVAMSVVAGVLLFREILSPAIQAGVVLTIAGLLLMPRQREVPEALRGPVSKARRKAPRGRKDHQASPIGAGADATEGENPRRRCSDGPPSSEGASGERVADSV